MRRKMKGPGKGGSPSKAQSKTNSDGKHTAVRECTQAFVEMLLWLSIGVVLAWIAGRAM